MPKSNKLCPTAYKEAPLEGKQSTGRLTNPPAADFCLLNKEIPRELSKGTGRP